MDTTRTTHQIHADIARAYTQGGPLDHVKLGRLWREMVRAAHRDMTPPWAILAATLCAGDHEDRAAQRRLRGEA